MSVRLDSLDEHVWTPLRHSDEAVIGTKVIGHHGLVA